MLKTARGFTLIELMVVISIMALLGIIAFAKIGTLRETQQLKSAANDLQSIIKTAQNNAASNFNCMSTTPPTYGVPWIVSLTPDNVTLSCSGSVIKTLSFDSGITICSVNYTDNSGNKTCTPDDCSSADTSFAKDGGNPPSISYASLSSQVSFTDDPTRRCLPNSISGSTMMKIGIQRSGGTPIYVNVGKGGSIEINQ